MRRRPGRIGLALIALALCGGCSVFSGTPLPAHVQEGHLTDVQGYSLYTYDRDIAWGGSAKCAAVCAQRFTPFIAPPGVYRVGDYELLRLSDGRRQWTFRGKPLYRYAGDQAPGQTGGEAEGNLWRLARP
jgi:predicted lipoprotein with Yx(FWY)xxD motif